MSQEADSAVAKLYRVTVRVSARLHMGFLNLCTMPGAHDYGGVGLSLNEPRTSISVSLATRFQAHGLHVDGVTNIVRRLAAILPADPAVTIQVQEAIPRHIGLGSGTQLAMAVGKALCLWFDRDIDAARLASVLGRGQRSGIGIGAFTRGGFLVDAGVAANGRPPDIAEKRAVPEGWRFVLVYDESRQGLHGKREAEFFQKTPVMPEDMSTCLAKLVSAELLPAIETADCARFGAALTEFQELNGRCFSEAQGGIFTSPLVEKVLRRLHKDGAAGIGQSSWGPTGFALYGSQREAERAVYEAKSIWREEPDLSFAVSAPDNSGAEAYLEKECDTRPSSAASLADVRKAG